MTSNPPTNAPSNPRPPHAYDDPQITSVNFLLAVMHDPTVGLPARIQAATYALPFMHPLQPPCRVHPDLIIRVAPLSVDDLEGAPQMPSNASQH
jgi:hypothetical protein